MSYKNWDELAAKLLGTEYGKIKVYHIILGKCDEIVEDARNYKVTGELFNNKKIFIGIYFNTVMILIVYI